MCLIKETTVTHPGRQPEIKQVVYPCSNAVGRPTCENVQVETARRSPDLQLTAARPSTRSSNQVVVHQEGSRPRQEHRERRYDPNLSVRFRGWRSPVFGIREIRDERAETYHDGGHRRARDPPPEAPEPPLYTVVDRSDRGSSSPPPLSAITVPPNRPTPPQGPAGAAAFTTRDAMPSYMTLPSVASSSREPSTASTTRSRDAHMAVQTYSKLTVAPPSHGSMPDNPRRPALRVNASSKWQDSGYGSSNMSPTEGPKPDTISDTISDTRSITTSRPSTSANDRSNNYTNEIVRRERDAYDDEDAYSSRKQSTYRLLRRRVLGNPEETSRKMEEDMQAALEHQSLTSEQGEGSVASGSRRRVRRHRHRDGTSSISDQ